MGDIQDLDQTLHTIARSEASLLVSPDKKQLHFNDIVQCAKKFYNDPKVGVRELVESCDKGSPDIPNPLYVKKSPMWDELNKHYGWMV